MPLISGAWNASDEAAQYLEEANWALKWRMYPEAQAAAESAWALGMRNVDSALLTGSVNTTLLSDQNVPQDVLLNERWNTGNIDYQITVPTGWA